MTTTITVFSRPMPTLFSRHKTALLIGSLALMLRQFLVLILGPSPDLSGGDALKP
jgi:hypothetical protein